MYIYLMLNIFIIIFPFLLSFHRKVNFQKRWPSFIGSFFTVGTSFIIWDAYATARGHWSFNEEYIVGVKLFGLPIEEIMFFFTVPYACLFTYESLRNFTRNWRVPYRSWPYLVIGGTFIVLGTAFRDQGYTCLVLILCGILSIILPYLDPGMISSRTYWLYLLITFCLFIIFNMVLTAIPVVMYSPDHIWGGNGAWNGRFFTIPLEDFFYNILMLTWFLLAYRAFDRFFAAIKGKRT
ncbi:MAG: lycopene cyclase domain-containing protein [Candidatus Thermoplasmatota archaeon]|nr:lycopene cyclase domain-containing protein [Candidatus Thermoplasmatota archaeon]